MQNQQFVFTNFLVFAFSRQIKVTNFAFTSFFDHNLRTECPIKYRFSNFGFRRESNFEKYYVLPSRWNTLEFLSIHFLENIFPSNRWLQLSWVSITIFLSNSSNTIRNLFSGIWTRFLLKFGWFCVFSVFSFWVHSRLSKIDFFIVYVLKSAETSVTDSFSMSKVSISCEVELKPKFHKVLLTKPKLSKITSKFNFQFCEITTFMNLIRQNSKYL